MRRWTRFSLPATTTETASVDAADYSFWKSRLGSTTQLAADGNNDGIVDAADYTIWRDHLAVPGAGGLGTVPEPVSGTIVGQMLLIQLLIGRFKRFSGR